MADAIPSTAELTDDQRAALEQFRLPTTVAPAQPTDEHTNDGLTGGPYANGDPRDIPRGRVERNGMVIEG